MIWAKRRIHPIATADEHQSSYGANNDPAAAFFYRFPIR